MCPIGIQGTIVDEPKPTTFVSILNTLIRWQVSVEKEGYNLAMQGWRSRGLTKHAIVS